MRTLIIVPLAGLVVALPAPTARAQDPATRMDQIVQSYVANRTFMGSVLVARGSDILFSKGYGSANLELDVPNSPSTKFRLGSITKQFTAASILPLEERGKLSVADPVKKYLPDAPAAWDGITIFNLLTHTSGIPNFTSFPEYQKLGAIPVTPAELVGWFRDKPLDFAPGTSWSYSNSGYALLGYLIERVSGQSYASFVHDNLFTPLGMNESGYDVNATVMPNRAAGYTSRAGKFENAGYVDMTIPYAAGALYSTTVDLLRWEEGLFNGRVLKAASLTKMTTPFRNNYAFGLVIDTTAGKRSIAHDGGIQGFNTLMAYYPEDKLTVVVLGNVNGTAPNEIGPKLAAIARGQVVTLASERREIPLDSLALSRFVGAYRAPTPGAPVFLITQEGKNLFARLGNQQFNQIFPESATSFFLRVVDAQLEFTKPDVRRRPGVLTLHQNGIDQSFLRMSDLESKSLFDAAAALAKRYQEQKPAAGSEAALKRFIEELRAGKPSYDQISPGPAQSIRIQLPALQADIVALGAIKSTAFKGVGPGGADIYYVTFEKGVVDYRIWMTPDGKIDNVQSRKLQ